MATPRPACQPWVLWCVAIGGTLWFYLFWVVTGGDHDAYSFALEVFTPEDGQESDGEHDRVEDVGPVPEECQPSETGRPEVKRRLTVA